MFLKSQSIDGEKLMPDLTIWILKECQTSVRNSPLNTLTWSLPATSILVLQKDFRILFKEATEGTLTDDEKGYLLKIRQHYTPQSLAMVKQLLGGGNVEKPFDFTKLTLTIKKEQTTIIQEIST